ncbi:hypothetical protein D9C73_013087 [Collichthys lucidus]|uniref:Sterile alpha motif domain-containing protein 3 n=1 Tax=Collichthys lucidus TaxID=240159 RepID=A0A4U5USI0_COLLU|nr:hypothetical protein D9C73_013087 [Collichthys lucidus]
MDKLDDVSIATLRAANIGEDLLPSLSRDDIKDLFPGPENFLRRRAIWLVVNKDEKVDTAPEIQQSPPTGGSNLSKEEASTSKFLTMSNPQYIVFTDSELEQVRRTYFEQKRLGTEHSVALSNELLCRLIRNTMTNMISIARATEDCRYPTKHEVNAMAKRLVEYYPMIKGQSSNSEWEHVAKKLMKRLSNVRSPRKAKVPPSKKRRQDTEVSSDISTTDDVYDGDSSASTIILEHSPISPMGIPVLDLSTRASTPLQSQDTSDETSGSVDFMDSLKPQARHYKTLQEMFKSKKPNKAAITHLLNLEFESRRCFITSDVLKEQDRPTKILEAYPCFRELDHVLDELQRVIQPTNSQYISEMKSRWEAFYSKVQFYGVMKKAMKPPKTLNGVAHVTAVFRALPLLFPSSTMPPKKLGLSSEALFHVLTTSEDPDGFLRQRQLSCPVVLVSKDNCMIAVGNMPVTTFNTERFNEGLLYLMAYYYALHLTYPKCISTLLSVLQTEILQDSIHEQDMTPSYKKAIGEWKSFIE